MDVFPPRGKGPDDPTFLPGHRRDEDLHGRAQGAVETALRTRDVGVGVVVAT